ncbi:HAD family phosphatase [Clostridium sp. Sa3CUN1]|uniref:HAD family phosphatase n=1 Tax=Clostridium gallinarum TaxID=2762246 RepID=A0ABR8Q5X1_9CLOT|nr:HAD family phosphatase [Clostridium gallinarum]MBD7915780.1 HAD family phosphatase [Clostridium gallinarum]
MRKVELVIFDMDGLIFDSEKVSYDSWVEAAKIFNINFDMKIFYKLLGTNHESVRNTLIDEFGDKINIDDYIEERRKINFSKIANGVERKEGVEELLEYLTEKNIKKAVATSSNRELALNLLSKADILHYFDYVLCGDEVTKSKPDPEVFLNVAKKLKVNPENCMVLEDSEAGTIAGSRGRMKVIIIPDLKEPDEDIVRLAYKRLNNLKEVINEIETINL